VEVVLSTTSRSILSLLASIDGSSQLKQIGRFCKEAANLLWYLKFIFRAFIGLAPISYEYILANISLFLTNFNIYFMFLLFLTFFKHAR